MSTEKDKKTGVETTGHEWDGIQEYNNPLPKWWLYIFYATIIWGIGYTIAYPAWPGIKSATTGMLGFSTRADVAAEIARVDEANAEIRAQLAAADLNTISDNPELYQFAVNGGAALFRGNCSQCHGSGAAGAKGYPNLLDNDWLWGGTIDDIVYTVTHGIRNEQSPDSRYSEMPAYGEIFSKEEINAVVDHVMTFTGGGEANALGAELFADNCAACHGENGTGDITQGAPNLSDAIWLYGGDRDTLVETVTYARFGSMPAWSGDYRENFGLDEAEVKAVATYVHQLGGGQ